MNRHRLMRLLALITFTTLALGITTAADPSDSKKSPYITVQAVKGTLEKFDKTGKMTVKVEVPMPTAQNRMAKKVEQMVFEMEPSSTVRTMILPPKESDNPKKPARYTAAELKMLKGPNPKLPGYEAKTEDLRGGLIVQLELGLTKEEVKEKSTMFKVKSVIILGEVMGK